MKRSFQRICAMLLRHLYILRSSPPRLVEIIYWPSIQMVLWGFIGRFFALKAATAMNVALGTFLGAVLLWDMLFRSQIGVSFSYLEEVWARNLMCPSILAMRIASSEVVARRLISPERTARNSLTALSDEPTAADETTTSGAYPVKTRDAVIGVKV